jgi:NAD(P)H-hydrate epimerase
MSFGIDKSGQMKPLLKKASVVAIGPGLGISTRAQQLYAKALDSDLPLIIDADALNLLAENRQARGNWILTPHPGEAARLLGCTVSEVQADRFHAVREIAEQFQAVCVLKGAGSLISAAGSSETFVCDRGHPGMASGGMGDVLTGVIAAVLGQCNNAYDATKAGVWLHAVAAEQAAKKGERGIVATDLLVPLQAQVNGDG